MSGASCVTAALFTRTSGGAAERLAPLGKNVRDASASATSARARGRAAVCAARAARRRLASSSARE
jgi:hypothetical protein